MRRWTFRLAGNCSGDTRSTCETRRICPPNARRGLPSSPRCWIGPMWPPRRSATRYRQGKTRTFAGQRPPLGPCSPRQARHRRSRVSGRGGARLCAETRIDRCRQASERQRGVTRPGSPSRPSATSVSGRSRPAAIRRAMSPVARTSRTCGRPSSVTARNTRPSRWNTNPAGRAALRRAAHERGAEDHDAREHDRPCQHSRSDQRPSAVGEAHGGGAGRHPDRQEAGGERLRFERRAIG